MNCCKVCALALVAAMGMCVYLGSVAIAEPPKDPKQAGQDMKLPPGWTQEDMQACTIAATPGQQQKYLTKSCGVWDGKNTMWMAPDTEPIKCESVSTVTPLMDGRYIKCDVAGDMPGMGPFHGLGIYGFDNVSQKFQCTWIDNCGTGIMTGTGELSSDGSTMTWTSHYTCPISKKLVTMREIQKTTGPDTKTIEMWGVDPKSGKEFKMMEISLTRKPGTGKTAELPSETR